MEAMSNLEHNEIYRQEMHRQANQERLARLVQKQPRPSIYRSLLNQIGRQMSHLGNRLQQANQEQPVRWNEAYSRK
jgi:hypothetical protein